MDSRAIPRLDMGFYVTRGSCEVMAPTRGLISHPCELTEFSDVAVQSCHARVKKIEIHALWAYHRYCPELMWHALSKKARVRGQLRFRASLT